MKTFLFNQIFFVRHIVFISMIMSLIQSLLFYSVANAQASFFNQLAENSLLAEVITAFMLNLFIRGLWQFVISCAHDYALIKYYYFWLKKWGKNLRLAPASQRARLISYDLKEWLHCLVQQSQIFFQDCFQLLFFGPIAYQALAGFGQGTTLFLGIYVIAINLISCGLQQYAIALEQRQDRIEGYWQARLYRSAQLTQAASHRYQQYSLMIYQRRQLLIFLDALRQTISLMLPVLLLYFPLRAGKITVEQYVLFSQACYNILPALSHISQYRAIWARGFSCAKRLNQELLSSGQLELTVGTLLIS